MLRNNRINVDINYNRIINGRAALSSAPSFIGQLAEKRFNEANYSAVNPFERYMYRAGGPHRFGRSFFSWHNFRGYIA